MTEILVEASRQYPVTIGKNTLSHLEKALEGVKKVCIVTDHNVWFPHEKAIRRHIPQGCKVRVCILTPGEGSKNMNTVLNVINLFASEGLTRNDCVIAFGGGVIGDRAGFAAAIYLRGIPYIQVPTSLLAMVDSSVGGKTGIDLPAGKNLCGAFYQPKAVICDTELLATLPREDFRDGCAEIIKYAVLFDPELFAVLEKDGLDFDREWVITRCIEHKKTCVQADEFDRGQRMLLNLGHTVGHAIEKVSNYTFSHGKAVAIGMATLCRATKCADTDRILALLEKFGLPVAATCSAKDLWNAALADKKRSGVTVNLIVPKSIGCCEIVPTDVDAFKTLLKEGL